MNAWERPSAGSEKVFRRLSYLLVFLMMASCVLTIVGLISRLLPDWHAGIIAVVLLFLVVDRLYTYRALKPLTFLSSEWVTAVGAQWLVITIFLRLLLSYANGLDAFLRDLSLYIRGDFGTLLTAEFVMSWMLALLLWFLTGRFLSLLDEIGLDQAAALQDDAPPLESNAVPARQRLVDLIFSLGIALVIFTGLARLDLRTVVSTLEGTGAVEITRFSGGEAGTLLYFAFGLALLSLSRLMSLQTRWNRNRIPISSRNLMRQWGVYSLVFLLILAVFVSLLPAGDSLGLFSLLGTLLSFLAAVLFFIGQMILILVALLFSLPLLFLRGEPVETTVEPPPMPTFPSAEAVAAAPDNEVWMVVRSILLWGGLIVIVVFALIHFVRQHGGVRAALRNSRVRNWLLLAWQWLYRNADKTRGTVARAITEGWQTLVSRLERRQALTRPGFFRLRALDPRRQIYFFYLAMVRRGAEQGVARKPSQTPSEYAVQLEQALPAAEEDIDAITGAFMEARYSRRDVNSGQVGRVRAAWGRIRRAFQIKSKKERAADQ